MNGATEAQYLSATALSSRLVRFPDGISRLITLKNSYWDVVDYLHVVEGWPETALPELALQHARDMNPEAGLSEEQIRQSFALIVEAGMPLRLPAKQGAANNF